MCAVALPFVMAGVGALQSFLSISAQNEQADAQNRALEQQASINREAQQNFLIQQSNKQRSVNEQSVAKKFQMERQNMRELASVRARNATALGVSAQRAEATAQNNLAVDLSILNANRDTALRDIHTETQASQLSFTNSQIGLKSRAQTGVDPLMAGLGIISGGLGGFVGGTQAKNSLKPRI